jgi:hypothetical protein
MLQRFRSFLDVSRSFAGRMRDERDALRFASVSRGPVSFLGRESEGNTIGTERSG